MEVNLILLSNLVLDAYQGWKNKGASDAVARARAIADGIMHYRAGHDDWKQAMAQRAEPDVQSDQATDKDTVG